MQYQKMKKGVRNKVKIKFFLLFCFLITIFQMDLVLAAADGVCSGRFINPITDICWKCLFPLTLGSMELVHSRKPDTKNPSNPVCVCQNGDIPRVGIKLGYWEPARLVEVTRHPYCFIGLGGKILNLGGAVGTGTANVQVSDRSDSSYQVHWYVYPLIYWLELVTDAVCVEKQGFDLAWLTELDPTWQDDELAFILNPEAVLFSGHIAQAACAADCTKASIGLPMDSLFWCAGCQGSIFPLTGHVQATESGVQASLLLAERMTFKMHRMGLLWGTYGGKAICSTYPMLTMAKSQYRAQMVYPIATTSLSTGCHPFGRTTALWEAGKTYPGKGEDFAYLIWRKRNCCAF